MEPKQTIQEKGYVVIHKVGGSHMRVARLMSKNSVLIEKLKFYPDNAFGQEYGLFDVRNEHLHSISSDSHIEEDKISMDLTKVDCANSGSVPTIDEMPAKRQKITESAINDLKATGVSGKEIISKLIEGSSSFSEQTTYAQEKYIKRKSRKHGDKILIFHPTIRLLSQVYYTKDPDRLANLRIDQLSQILVLANIHSGSKALIIEQCQGLITAGVVDRMGGDGCCIHLHKHEQAQGIPCLHSMNFDQTVLDSFYPVSFDDVTNLEERLRDLETKNSTSEINREDADVEVIEKFVKKRAKQERLRKSLEMMKSKLVEAAIIGVKNYDPLVILKQILPFLLPSSPIVIYSPYVQPLLECYKYLKESEMALDVQLSDNLLRKHQVLPGRTHPEMLQSVTSGFLLSAITVLQK